MKLKKLYKKPLKSCEVCRGQGWFVEESCSDEYNVWYNKYRCSCSERLRKKPKKIHKKLNYLYNERLCVGKHRKKEIKKEIKKLDKKLKKYYDNNKNCNTDIFKYDKPF
jgi:hypothetical protein